MKEKVLKSYTIEMLVDESDGSKHILRRTCDGFNAYELLGLVTLAQQEIIHQIKGTIRPDVVERKVIVRTSKVAKTKSK